MVINLGTHDHHVAEGMCRIVVEQIKALVQEEVSCKLAISLATSKTFLFKHLLNEDGDRPIEPLKGDKLHQMMDKFTTLCFPNI
jgi:hypothetical protein